MPRYASNRVAVPRKGYASYALRIKSRRHSGGKTQKPATSEEMVTSATMSPHTLTINKGGEDSLYGDAPVPSPQGRRDVPGRWVGTTILSTAAGGCRALRPAGGGSPPRGGNHPQSCEQSELSCFLGAMPLEDSLWGRLAAAMPAAAEGETQGSIHLRGPMGGSGRAVRGGREGSNWEPIPNTKTKPPL